MRVREILKNGIFRWYRSSLNWRGLIGKVSSSSGSLIRRLMTHDFKLSRSVLNTLRSRQQN
jgi:hypothetical protein